MLEQMRAAVPEETRALLPPAPDLPEEGRRGLAASLRAAGNRVVVPDMRGHGDSDKPHDPASYRDSAMARDVLALMDHLQIERVDVVGYSMGAVVVSHLLALGDPRIRSAVLAGIGDYILAGEMMELPEGMPGTESLPRRVAFDVWAEHQAAGLDATADGSGPPSGYAASGADPRAMAAVLRGTITQRTPAATLQRVTLPVLVLNGTADFGNQQYEKLVGAFPNARAASCDGDHLISPFYPSFHQAIITFLQEQDRSDS
jgi:pimeloyl-ACP methyl ester carboxylesterase